MSNRVLEALYAQCGCARKDEPVTVKLAELVSWHGFDLCNILSSAPELSDNTRTHSPTSTASSRPLSVLQPRLLTFGAQRES